MKKQMTPQMQAAIAKIAALPPASRRKVAKQARLALAALQRRREDRST